MCESMNEKIPCSPEHVSTSQPAGQTLDLEKGSWQPELSPVSFDLPVLPAIAFTGHIPLNSVSSFNWDKGSSSDAGLIQPSLTSHSPKPPPDGGLLAWSQVLAGHLTAFNSWGYVNSFGLFQAYYTTSLHASPSAISWIGGVQIFLMMFIGIFSGRAMDAGYYRPLAIAGLSIQLLGVFMTSLVSEYWQLLLVQGFCQGIGSGLVFTPTMAVVSSYFSKRKALAVCGMSSGTATGGVVFPIIARQLLPSIGIQWTIRVMGFVFLSNAIIAQALIRPRPVPKKGGPLFDMHSFLSLWFCLFSLGMFLGVLGLYFTYYYITSYAQTILHANTSTSFTLLLLTNAVGLPGRIAPAYIADHLLGAQNTAILIVLLTGILTFAWAGISSLPGLWAFAAIYGFVAAGMQSMVPPALASAGRDPAKTGVEMGMVFAGTSVAALCGPPIAGALVEADGGEYLYAQMWAGSVVVVGGLVLVGARMVCTGGKLWKRA